MTAALLKHHGTVTNTALESAPFVELLICAADQERHHVREALRRVLPWVCSLPDADVELLVEEFVATVRDAGPLGDTAPVSRLLRQWRHTGEIHADPAIHRAMTGRDLGDFGEVPRPVGVE